MAGESFDSLKDLPRVPHSEGNGIQVGVGGNPPNRRYVTYGAAVDSSVAVARLSARRKGEMPLIPGGLDDHDPRLFVKPEAPLPMAKMKVAQSKPLTEEDVMRLKSETKTSESTVTHAALPVSAGIVSNGISGHYVEAHDELLADDMGGPAGKDRQPRNDKRPVILPQASGYVPPSMPDVSVSFQQPSVVYVEKPVEKIVEKVVEKETEASKWLRQRTRVEIGTSETTFNVSAISVVRSMHAVTVILPTANDAMTFVPRTGAKVKIRYNGAEALDTIFTGASFEIPELGILGLAFLVPKGDGD